MVYVITAVHNRYAITEKFVELIDSQTLKDIRLILVDDGCTDGTVEMVKKKLADSIVLKGDGNLWWGGALHLAYKYVKDNLDDNDIVCIANDDTFFPNDYFEKAVTLLNDMNDTLLVGNGLGKLTNNSVDGAINFDFKHCRKQVVPFNNGVSYGNCASTRNIFCRVKDMLAIGGFHPILLPHYYSDYEWTIRAHEKKGYKICCVQSLKYDVNEATTSDRKAGKSSIKKLFSKRSASNPIYKIIFIIIAVPTKYRAIALVNQIKNRNNG